MEYKVNLKLVEMLNLIAWTFHHEVECPLRGKSDIKIAQSDTSGIGTKTVVECTCGAKEDITDYGAW